MTAKSEMSPKQRWLAAVRGEPVDRLAFWPKLDGAYPRAQAEPFRGWDLDAIHTWIGSDGHKLVPTGCRERRASTSVETTTDSHTRTTVFRSPYGQCRRVEAFDEGSQAWHPVVFPVQSVEDLKIMTAFYADGQAELDQESWERSKSIVDEIGDSALTAAHIGESPLMHFVEWLAGVEMAHYLLADCTSEAEELFDAIHGHLLRRADVLARHCPADVLYMIENTSTTLISPEQYRRYCRPHISEYAEITEAAGKPLFLHMCGHMKALLGDLATLGFQAWESCTSPPVGDTTLGEARAALPNTCLVGGTNAALWTQPAEAIIDEIARDLDGLDHHRGIVVTSAGIMPPLCPPETIKQVCQWVKGYPVRV